MSGKESDHPEAVEHPPATPTPPTARPTPLVPAPRVRLRDGALKPRFLLSLPFILTIRSYQVVLGPVMGGHCRFHPTCSEYGLEAYRRHGPLRGTWLTLRRILRCHPFGGSGFDPVP